MHIFLTGANRGIGLEFARQFIARGDRVIASVREPAAATALQELAANASGALEIIALDTTSPEGWCAVAGMLMERSLDLLVNNAGIYRREGPLGEFQYEAFRESFEVNTLAPLRGLEACLPALRRGTHKKVVTLTSKMGSITENTSGGAYAYRTSKTSVNSAMRSAALDLKSEGFTVAVFHPGWVQTEMGGPNALIDVHTSVSSMLKQIDDLRPSETGSFLEWSGGHIGW